MTYFIPWRRSAVLAVVVIAAVSVLAFFGTGAAGRTAVFNIILVPPLSISETQQLNFGRLAANGTAGTITVEAFSGARSATGGVELLSNGGEQAGTFLVTGEASTNFDMGLETLPITLSNGKGGTVDITDWLFLVDWMTLDNGTQPAVSVGGTVSIAADQAPGTYTGIYRATVMYE